VRSAAGLKGDGDWNGDEGGWMLMVHLLTMFYGELNGIDDAAFVYQMGMEYI